jgi:hypothetical protein
VPNPDQDQRQDTIDVCVVDESLYTEDRVSPIDRVLALRGLLGERAIKHIRQNMRAALRGAEPTLPEQEREILRAAVDDFLALDRLKSPVYASASFGYADIPLGKAFGAVFNKLNPVDGANTQCVLRAVINEWMPIAMDGVPRGHRSICVFEFPQGVPALVKHLPRVGYPTPANVEDRVYLCSVDTWELRKSKT